MAINADEGFIVHTGMTASDTTHSTKHTRLPPAPHTACMAVGDVEDNKQYKAYMASSVDKDQRSYRHICPHNSELMDISELLDLLK